MPSTPYPPVTGNEPCKRQDPERWFPGDEEGVTAEYAKNQCDTCPIKDACLAYALADPDMSGIWGGSTTKQRARLRGGRPEPVPAPKPRPVVVPKNRSKSYISERREAVQRLTDSGWSSWQIARELKINARSVVRIRAAIRDGVAIPGGRDKAATS